jgi:prepilin-type N-terminal cleavage/methylation domain-containing protein
MSGRTPAFTLVELLIVIGIIGLIAGMLVAFAVPKAQQSKIHQAEAELQSVVMAIDSFHSDFGSYPPDNTNNLDKGWTTYGARQEDYLPPLFYELTGAVQNPSSSPDTMTFGSNAFLVARKDYFFAFGLEGPQNSTPDTLKNYLPHLRPSQYKALPSGPYVLTCSIGTDATPTGMNPWRYHRSNATNNPASYDLYVPLVIGNKTNFVKNWSP